MSEGGEEGCGGGGMRGVGKGAGGERAGGGRWHNDIEKRSFVLGVKEEEGDSISGG